MTLEKLNQKKARYDVAVEALQELIENDKEIEPLKNMIVYLRERRQKAIEEWKTSENIKQIEVK